MYSLGNGRVNISFLLLAYCTLSVANLFEGKTIFGCMDKNKISEQERY